MSQSLLSKHALPQSQSPPPPPPPPPIRRRSSASPSPTVKVTRKVIRTLEGLGHTSMEDDSSNNEFDEGVTEECEVADVLGADEEVVSRVAGKQRAVEEKERKIDWEIPRKVFHSSIGFLTLGLYLTPSMSPRVVTIVLWALLAIIAPTDFVRLRVPAVERVYERWLGFLMRESEKTGTNGTLWYILGVNFALTFYPIDVATVAILILSWADTAASTVGRAYGRRTPPLPSAVSVSFRVPGWWPREAEAEEHDDVSSAPSAKSTAVEFKANGHANGHVDSTKAASQKRSTRRRHRKVTLRIPTPFAPRKSTAGFAAACVTGSLVALVFWAGLLGQEGSVKGVAEMRAVAEGSPNAGYHSQYSIAGQYLRSRSRGENGEEGKEGVAAWVGRWLDSLEVSPSQPSPSALSQMAWSSPTVAATNGSTQVQKTQTQHATTPARFGVKGVLGLAPTVVWAGLVSGVAEALDLGGLDDNLTLPIISGGMLMVFFRLWGWVGGRV
ncbi:hypothetical protein R3P38DRAFT_3190096 [Favolaschia claudopus]|uniref:Phosphatidate cytidylyltransferase n=1 Tax=Favolaschia claudopus TaxID=2862362 RepID=A0AAW0BQT4_9AGAR